jgi:hypothetical protein
VRSANVLLIPLLALLALTPACGDDEPPAAQRGFGPGGAKKAGGGKAPASKKGKTAALRPAAQVPDELRRGFDKVAFVPDPTGDVNRDPFRPFLFNPAPGARDDAAVRREDVCQKRVIAPDHGYRQLRLVGVVLRGTRSYALFTDPRKHGHIANRGDCLSKDKVRVKHIGADRVTLTIQGDAPPGAPAPPPRDEVILLHPRELAITEDDLRGGDDEDE